MVLIEGNILEEGGLLDIARGRTLVRPHLLKIMHGVGLEQGSPTPKLQTGTSLWPVKNQAAQLEV